MKKVLSFSILVISILFMSMSCEKDPIDPDPVFPTEIKTAADLNGTWEFVSVNFFSEITTCEQIQGIPSVTDAELILSFEFDSSNETVTITDACPNPHSQFEDYLYDVNGITISVRPDSSSGAYMYSIVSYNNSLGILVLNMPVFESDFSDRRATITLQKI